MQYNPVGWFEIPVTDLDRAETFYKALLGVEFARQPEHDGIVMSWFPMYENAIGAMGSLVKSEGFTPSHEGSLVYFTRSNLEEAERIATESGGKVLMPKKSIGEHGFITWIEDTEGNRIALHSMEG